MESPFPGFFSSFVLPLASQPECIPSAQFLLITGTRLANLGSCE